MKGGQPQRADTRLFMQLLGFGGCADPSALADALVRAAVPGVLYEDMNDPRGVALLTFDEDPAFFLDRVRPLLTGAAVCVAGAEARVHDGGTELLDRVRAGPPRCPAAASPADGAESRLALGGLVPAPPERAVRAAPARRAAGDSRRARHDRHVVRRRRSRARHPARLSRPRQGRQRLRHRPHRQGSVSAVRDRAGDEEDAADGAVSGAARSVLRRPGGLAERRNKYKVQSAEGQSEVQSKCKASLTTVLQLTLYFLL